MGVELSFPDAPWVFVILKRLVGFNAKHMVCFSDLLRFYYQTMYIIPLDDKRLVYY